MKKFIAALSVPVVVGCLLYAIGCEVESADSPVSIEPRSATVHKGESVTFTAIGGYGHTWALSTAAYGTLDRSSGPTTTYKARNSPTNDYVQITLTLSSSTTGTTSTGSNSTATATSTALITQMR